ncbi:hypothetical protein AADG42_14335 [Ammonicoccus fulvus]|uniref:Uncharacterized protein n=1 Tax=Ammonicoccus fulvus TaxID=3138240 RepID=A0ABZ3FRS7_9ACTN
MRRTLAGLALLLALSACSGETAASQDAPATPTPSPTPSPTRVVAATVTPTPRTPATSAFISGATLTADGLGPIQLGMTLADAVREGWAGELPHCDRWGSSPRLLADGVDLVFDDSERLSEIWLGNATYQTPAGAYVGLAAEDVAVLYGDRLDYEPRGSVGGSMQVMFTRAGDNELVFFALGNEDTIPDPRSPISAIGARAYGGDIDRPSC